MCCPVHTSTLFDMGEKVEVKSVVTVPEKSEKPMRGVHGFILHSKRQEQTCMRGPGGWGIGTTNKSTNPAA